MVAFILSLSIFEPIGGQKIGTTFGSFLKMGVGSRQEALFTGMTSEEDATFLWWNSSLASFSEGKKISFYYKRMVLDISHAYFGFTMRRKYTGIGVFVNSLWTPYQEVTTEYDPYGNGYYWNYSDIVIGISISQSLYDRFAVGMNIKFMQENIYDTSYNAYMLDFNSIYFIGYRDIRIGMGIFNIGPDVKGWSLPVIFRLSVSGRAYRQLFVYSQLEKQSDNYELFSFGLEYRMKHLDVRGGFNSLGHYAFGFGMKIGNMSVDISYTSKHLLGDQISFTTGVFWK